jgi:hypothetical protein
VSYDKCLGLRQPIFGNGRYRVQGSQFRIRPIRCRNCP